MVGWPDFLSTGEGIAEVVSVRGIKLHKKPQFAEIRAGDRALVSQRHGDAAPNGETRQRGLELPDLEQARKDFEAWIGGAIDW